MKHYRCECTKLYVLTSTIRKMVVPEESCPNSGFDSQIASITCLLSVGQINSILDKCLKHRHVYVCSQWLCHCSEFYARLLCRQNKMSGFVDGWFMKTHLPALHKYGCLPQEMCFHRLPLQSWGRITWWDIWCEIKRRRQRERFFTALWNLKVSVISGQNLSRNKQCS